MGWRGVTRHGRRVRASMDGFTASPPSHHPSTHTHTRTGTSQSRGSARSSNPAAERSSTLPDVPVAEHDAPHRRSVDVEPMHRWTMRMTVDQRADAACDGMRPEPPSALTSMICAVAVVRACGFPRASSAPGPPACEAQVPEDPPHDRIAHDPTQPLIAHVVGAEHVAVHQQHALAVELDDRAVGEQRAPVSRQKRSPSRKSRLPCITKQGTPESVSARSAANTSRFDGSGSSSPIQTSNRSPRM